jgi:pimeloyl-ACP methyl ester carboxylesterase
MGDFHKRVCLLTIMACIVVSGCGLFVKHIPAGRISMMTPSAKDQFIKVGQVNYHYAEYPAEGPDVLMVHGWSSSTYTWEQVAPELQKKGYHVWSLDMQGFGWTDKPGGVAYDPLTLMQGVKDWMDTVGLKQVIYVGNSLGGGIGLLLSVEHPEMIDRLILIDAAIYPHKKPFIITLAGLPGASIGSKMIFGRWMISSNLKEVFYHADWVTDERIDAYYTRMRTNGALDAMIAIIKAMDFKKLEPYAQRAAQIKRRTLIMHGKNDIWIPIEDSYALRRQIPDSVMAVIPACGHVPQEEHPEITSRLILDFLNGTLTKDTLLTTLSNP